MVCTSPSYFTLTSNFAGPHSNTSASSVESVYSYAPMSTFSLTIRAFHAMSTASVT